MYFPILLGHIGLLRKHQPELIQWISLSELLPYLNRHELLTRPENEVLLNSAVTHHDRVLKLLSFIEKKGPSGYEKFLEALEDETSHLGHKEVVKLLKASTQESISGPEIISRTETNIRIHRISVVIFTIWILK